MWESLTPAQRVDFVFAIALLLAIVLTFVYFTLKLFVS